GQANWVRWFESDSPEGAYQASIKEASTSVVGNIPLGRTLAPGRYYLAVKILDYSTRGRLELRMGGSTTPVTNLNLFGPWTAIVTNDLPVATTNLQIEVYRTIVPLGTRQLYLLKGIYITSIPERLISGTSDSILNVHYPTDAETDTNAPVKGNLVEN